VRLGTLNAKGCLLFLHIQVPGHGSYQIMMYFSFAMAPIKISIITVTYNAGSTFERCLQSVLAQDHNSTEYIVVDGGSTDTTVEIAQQYSSKISQFISEPDQGIYDAMNKGLRLATGAVIGILNADDFFADEQVLSDIASAFRSGKTQIVYGDLDFIDGRDRTIRKWRSGKYKPGRFNWGWMPPHPTFYCRRELFSELGPYSLDYGSAADYELMLRFLHKRPDNEVTYINRVMIRMLTGGVSNSSLKNRLRATANDLEAMRKNGISYPLLTILCKPLRKLGQFF
jgi:glycosyltransferase involved in cell wall biosynthesis